MKFDLSYIIATRNRLPFLKIIVPKLLAELLPGEEIVIVDGNSTDGSKEYLQQLFSDNRIHQFLSEADRNQAHGWNKALLMAKGTIIKKLIDDDVHDFKAIRQCKNFMLANPKVDACISDALESNLTTAHKTTLSSRLKWYSKWKAGEISAFTFSDVHLLIRRSSLSFIGIYDIQFKMLDWEYGLRMSYLKANIAYFTGCNSLSVSTPGNVTSTSTKKQLAYEGEIGKAKYGYPGDTAEISPYSKLKIAVGKFIYGLKKTPQSQDILPSDDELKKIYLEYYRQLETYNNSSDHRIIG